MRIYSYSTGFLVILIILVVGVKSITDNPQGRSNQISEHSWADALSTHQSALSTEHLPFDFQIDDLVFFDSTFPPGRWNVRGLDHVVIYLGNDSFLSTMANKTTHVGEVNIISYDDLFHSWMLKNPRYARVNTTPEQRHAATQWVCSRIGDTYQTWDPRKCADPNASIITAKKWYCSEIVWAAYYNIGIDIDQNGWARDFPWFFPLWSSVSPQDIYDDNDMIHLT
jgi:hypothetical protein